MENPYCDYYNKQAGSGISVYAGHKYQTGGGFFGKILKQLKPALKYISRKGFDTMANIGSDFFNGENIIESGKKNLLNTAKDVLTDARTSLDEYKKKQTGGSRRKRSASRSKSRARSVSRKKKKTTKKLYKKKATKKKSFKKRVKKIDFF